MKRLSKQWWDSVLDGQIHEISVPETGYQGVNAFRSAVYQQADVRFRLAATHKSSPTTLVVQAWGSPGLPGQMPRLEGAAGRPVRLAPEPPAWQAPQRPTTTPQEQPPTMTVEPEAEQLSAADMEALLGPCTCGQSPTCAPSCARLA